MFKKPNLLSLSWKITIKDKVFFKKCFIKINKNSLKNFWNEFYIEYETTILIQIESTMKIFLWINLIENR